MQLTAQALAAWTLPPNLPPGPRNLAARELRDHLARVGAEGTGAGEIEILVGNGMGDGFTVELAARRVTLRGDSDRGCLNAAYWLLERLGFGWIEPGTGGVRFTPGKQLAQGEYREDPAFARRTLILGQDALHDNWRGWVEWASRNRLNDVFFHDTPPSRLDRGPANHPGTAEGAAADGGGWMFERWDAESEAIRAAASEAGMSIQFGGHHLSALVQRELFSKNPEWFPLRKDARDPRYNLCLSSAGAILHLRARARAFFDRFGGADVYHLWADDIRGGGWCECEGCEAMPASDQALFATNVLAEVLEEAAPGARIAHLAYHDTLLPPVSVRPRDNVSLLFAPRERCYAHAISDPACERNVPEYWTPFTGLRPLFGNDSARVDVFEYYSDAVLFKWLAPPLLGVLLKDAAAYASAGVGNLQNLMVSPRPWLGPPWHAWWMARCAWTPGISAEESLAEFCAAAYPKHAVTMAEYYVKQERAYRLILDLHDLAPAPRRDVLDFSSVPLETMRTKATELTEGAALLRELHQRIRDMDANELSGELRQAELTWHLVEHLAHRLSAWALSLYESSAELQADHAAAAESHLEWLEEWERTENQPAYANLSRRMLEAMRYHTAALA